MVGKRERFCSCWETSHAVEAVLPCDLGSLLVEYLDLGGLHLVPVLEESLDRLHVELAPLLQSLQDEGKGLEGHEDGPGDGEGEGVVGHEGPDLPLGMDDGPAVLGGQELLVPWVDDLAVELFQPEVGGAHLVQRGPPVHVEVEQPTLLKDDVYDVAHLYSYRRGRWDYGPEDLLW